MRLPIKKRKLSELKIAEDADTGGSSPLTASTGTNSAGSSASPTETNNGSSSSSTAPTGNSYDVFLSFRGPDTRDGFAGHLYSRLHFAKIHSFRDDKELRIGEEIGPDLLAAIKNSKISIPILSENYGSSSRCLDELVQIMKCKKSNTEYIVLPIFYKVAPADVRRQSGKFGEAFRERERRSLARGVDPTILKKWKKALEKVSNLSGQEVKGSEAPSIDLVVEQVLLELKKKFELVIPENLIGIDSHVEKVMEVVNNNSGAALFVVIHGMGGIGKTTLAKKIYNELSNRFKYRCFIPDVREQCERKHIVHLQNELISVILERDHKVSTRDEGIKFLASKINGKKVLILLDDVDKDDDLKALAGHRSWFSSGSIIIITTRNMSIIDKARGDYPYELEGMGRNNSTILFSRHAFRMDSPPSEFQELTDEVVSTTGGLPLALEILGSFLCGAERKIWTGTIKKLQKIPNEEVQEKLKISYDALSHGQKQIFLDIACFFIGADERIASYASYIWDAWDFFAVEIEVLRLRSLIKVGNNHELIMHDQLRDLGRWIVRERNKNTPQYCSKLWDSKEALEVLKEKKGISKIEALHLDNYGRINMAEDNWAEAEDNSAEQLKELTNYTAEQLKELTNLRFLHVSGANFTGNFQNLLPQLRWLHWDFYSLDFEATNFHLKKLVVLDLSQTGISEDWGGWDLLKMATELKVLNLSHCDSLTTTPDLSTFKSLEILILEGCIELKEIHPSLGAIKTLVSLNVRRCSRLKELPQWISSQNKLETLDASYCRRLARIPSSIGHLPSLSLLNLSHCNKLAQLPDSIGSLVALQRLLLSYCLSLREIPDSIGKLTSLTELDLRFSAIVELPDSIWNMQNLSILDVSGTRLFESDAIRIHANIQKLRASGCKNLEGLPGELVLLNTFSSLQNVSIRCFRELPSCFLARVLSQHPRTPPTNNLAIDHQTADSEHVLKRSKPFGISDEVSNLPVNNLHVTFNRQSHGQSTYFSDDLPRNVVMTLNQGSPVKTMDFHPVQQILLLVGTDMGDVIVWKVGSCARIAVRNFKVWDLGTCSKALQASLANDNKASVNRVRWSPDGILFGVAYSKHIVHIYLYLGGDDIRNHLEIEAHDGSVNDLAFSYPNKQLCVVTCGEDRLIKVWDAVTGAKQHNFEGHEAPVYSICPHYKENSQFIFSTATDGKIKVWLYDNLGFCFFGRYKNLGSRVDYDAPGHSSTTMAYSADGTRLFSCGTNKEGESYLVEWNQSEGAVKRPYLGLGEKSGGVVQFDTTKNTFLAAGDEFMVKFWDMDNNYIWTSTDAEGGLPSSPCIRFNKEGILLAVSTSDNSIKILANADGIRLLRTVENWPFDASRVAPGPLVKQTALAAFGYGNATVGASLHDRGAPVAAMVIMNSERMADVKPKFADESGDKSRIWKLTEINEPSQCRSIRLPNNLTAMRVSRLIYTNSGCAILALSSNAVHKLWKWQKSDRNLTGRATTSVVPQLWQPPSGILMTNDISDTNPEDAVPCFALSKNDSYVMSASGGKISLFNMMTFKAMTTFMPPPPAATFLVFNPQDHNIIAIGMEDSSIQIYNVRVGEVKTKLKGHQKRITGLAFSNVLNVLVSSGADFQLCVWSTYGWEKLASKTLQMPTGRGAAPFADTRVQFHLDQIHLLVVHKTQIAIYEAPKLECLKQWVTREASGPITHATYSCDGQSIYVSFEDGSIGVLTASTLRFRCRINPVAYIPPNPSLRVYPLVIAAHPTEPNQFALGLTDGSVYVLEPSESEGKWGTSPPVENGAGPSTTTGAAASDQPQR